MAGVIVPIGTALAAAASYGVYLMWGSTSKPQTMKDEVEGYNKSKMNHVELPKEETYTEVNSEKQTETFVIITPEDLREYELKIRPVIDELTQVLHKRNTSIPTSLASQIQNFNSTSKLRNIKKVEPEIKPVSRDIMLTSIKLGVALKPVNKETIQEPEVDKSSLTYQIQNFSAGKLKKTGVRQRKRRSPTEFELQLFKRVSRHSD
jgi:hypothetical protein